MGSARYLLDAIRRAECACASTCFEKAFAAFTALLLGSKVFHVQQLRCSVVAHLRQVMFLMKRFWNVAFLELLLRLCAGAPGALMLLDGATCVRVCAVPSRGDCFVEFRTVQCSC